MADENRVITRNYAKTNNIKVKGNLFSEKSNHSIPIEGERIFDVDLYEQKREREQMGLRDSYALPKPQSFTAQKKACSDLRYFPDDQPSMAILEQSRDPKSKEISDVNRICFRFQDRSGESLVHLKFASYLGQRIVGF